jgi:UTP--glucose-1-phosphate uridylyltransferase
MARGRVRKAVIPAAGLGTRFLPATKATPKEMLPIVDKPTIQLVVEEAVAAGIEEIVLVNGRGKSSIEDHFDHAYELEHTLRERGKTELLELSESISNMVRLISVRQKMPLGLGHAVLCAREVVGDEPFAVLLGDDLIDNDERPGIGQLIEVYEQTGAAAIAVMEVPEGQEHLYGIVDGSDAGDGRIRVRNMVEKPEPGTAPTRNAIIGRYVLPPAIWELLASTKPGKGGEIQLTDGMLALAKGDPGLYGVQVEGTRHDAGDKLGYLRANLAYALKRPDLRDGLREVMRELLENG